MPQDNLMKRFLTTLFWWISSIRFDALVPTAATMFRSLPFPGFALQDTWDLWAPAGTRSFLCLLVSTFYSWRSGFWWWNSACNQNSGGEGWWAFKSLLVNTGESIIMHVDGLQNPLTCTTQDLWLPLQVELLRQRFRLQWLPPFHWNLSMGAAAPQNLVERFALQGLVHSNFTHDGIWTDAVPSSSGRRLSRPRRLPLLQGTTCCQCGGNGTFNHRMGHPMVGRAVPSNTLQGTLAGQGCGLTRLLHSKSTVGAPWSQHWLWLNVTFPPTLAWEISSLLCQCWRGRWRAEPFIAEPRAICGDLVPWTSIMSPCGRLVVKGKLLGEPSSWLTHGVRPPCIMFYVHYK